jgi:transposase, IS30 family
MVRKYKQLTARDRVLISRLKASGVKPAAIASRLRVARSTISRELKRNADNGYWKAENANKVRKFRVYFANQKRRRKSAETRNWVIQKLKENWSPEQIAGRSEFESKEKLCTETIYRIVHEDRKKGGHLFHFLKRFRKRKSRFPVRTDISFTHETIPNRRGIEERPSFIDQRSRLGDLEGDLIVGYRASGYVVTVIDRRSRLVALEKIDRKTKLEVLEGLERAIKRFGDARTITFDNGREFSAHEQLHTSLGIKTYFARPYCSTDKASIENANGLIRYYLPKRKCFKSLSQERLRMIEVNLNSRPRKILKFLTPYEVHFNQGSSNKNLLHL